MLFLIDSSVYVGADILNIIILILLFSIFPCIVNPKICQYIWEYIYLFFSSLFYLQDWVIVCEDHMFYYFQN